MGYTKTYRSISLADKTHLDTNMGYTKRYRYIGQADRTSFLSLEKRLIENN